MTSPPYFYVVGTSRPSALRGVIGVEAVDYTPYLFEGVSYAPSRLRAWKIYADKPKDVPKLREAYRRHGYRTSQAYISYVARLAVDEATRLLPDLSPGEIAGVLSERPRHRFLAFDVEVYGGNVVVGWTHDGAEVNLGSPREFLLEVWGDYVVGFNSWGFDARFVSGDRYRVGGVPHLNLYVLAVGFGQSLGVTERAYSLHEVARQVGLDLPFYGRWVRLKATRGAGALEEYLKYDVLATYRLAERWLDVLGRLAALTGIPVHALNVMAEKYSVGHIHEVVLSRYLAERHGILLEDRERKLEFSGAEKVWALAEGRTYRNIVEYDFNMLYPTIYYELQLDPIALRACEGGIEVLGVALCPEPGHVSAYLSALYRARAETKRLKGVDPGPDTAVKILANSAYGVFAKGVGSLVNEYVAATIFWTSQRIFEGLWRRLRPHRVVYGDTDSLYLLEDPGADRVNAEARAVARGVAGHWLRYGGENFSLKLEGRWDVFYLHRRKNYLKVAGGEVVVRGTANPKRLPVGLKYGDWRGFLRSLLDGGDACQLLGGLPLDELYLEASIEARDLFYKKTGGERLARLDVERTLIVGWIALSGGGTATVELRNGAVYVDGRPVAGILDARFIPVDAGQGRAEAIYPGPVRAGVTARIQGNKIIAEARVLGTPSEAEVRAALYRHLASGDNLIASLIRRACAPRKALLA